MAVLCSTKPDCVQGGTSPEDRAAVRSIRHFPRMIFVAGLVRLRAWFRRPVERRVLASLNDHYLRDIGLTAVDVEAERYLLSIGQSIESIRQRQHF